MAGQGLREEVIDSDKSSIPPFFGHWPRKKGA
jgi:hypothetical protein